ncbi:unnamed protein product [Mytilus coruscus]|uniref:Ig-like domain-containing protein n=1 Tax=Mytilus coruscus TaxID=42192 RepID=A0A6J8EL49_MYTCO|nr:unnamed protein product [Mytilus coruscus]
MGTKVAPTYANLVMGYLEIQMYRRSQRKFGHLFYKFLMENWKKYIDDCFILWNHTLDMLMELKDLLNEINENIQFTMEYNSNKLPFLDILIIKNGTNIETDIFYKPTDSKQYLLFTSCHPKHTRVNIPYNLAKRIYKFGEIVLSNKAQHTHIGETVVLSCRYYHGATKIRWRRWQGIIAKASNLKLKNADDRKRFNVVADRKKGDYNLEISDVEQSDSGLYWCEMRIGGQIMQQKVTLYIDTDDKFVLSNKAQHAYIGEKVILSCKYPHGATKVRWRRWQGIIAKGLDLNVENPDDRKRFNVVADEMKGEYNFEISGVIQSDSGLYWCEMRFGGQIMQQKVTLQIGKLLINYYLL